MLVETSPRLKFELKKIDPYVSFVSNEFIPQNEKKLFSGVVNKEAKEQYQVFDDFKKKNVILIIVDALRSDKINNDKYSRKLTPFLDSLTKLDNVLDVKNFYSTSSSSFQGISSTLSSSYKIFLNFFLHDLLKKQGYQINFLLSGDHTNWYSLKDFYGNNIDYFKDGYLAKKSNFIENANNDKFIIEELNQISEYNNEPKFFYLHMMSTHESSVLEEKYKIYIPNNYNVFDTDIPVKSLTNDYDNRVIQLDSYLKEIIQIWKKYLKFNLKTTWSWTIFRWEGFYLYKFNNLHEISIPLIIFSNEIENIKKEIKYEFSNQLDVSPTIIDMLGIEIPNVWEGSSILKPRADDFLFIQEREFFSCIWLHKGQSHQYIFNDNTKKEEVYNIDLDINLKNNILNENNNIPINYIRNRMKEHFLEISNKSIPN